MQTLTFPTRLHEDHPYKPRRPSHRHRRRLHPSPPFLASTPRPDRRPLLVRAANVQRDPKKERTGMTTLPSPLHLVHRRLPLHRPLLGVVRGQRRRTTSRRRRPTGCLGGWAHMLLHLPPVRESRRTGTPTLSSAAIVNGTKTVPQSHPQVLSAGVALTLTGISAISMSLVCSRPAKQTKRTGPSPHDTSGCRCPSSSIPLRQCHLCLLVCLRLRIRGLHWDREHLRACPCNRR
jgi:hypothetical protein